MKKLTSIIVLSFFFGTAAFAANGDDHKDEDPKKPEKETQYTFSLSKSWFSIFNLFNVEEEKKDTVIFDETDMRILRERPQ